MVRAPIATNSAAIIAVLTIGIFSGSAAWALDLAKVNGRIITDQDLKGALDGFNEGQREGILKDPNSRRQILSNLIDQELLMMDAEKAKLDQDEAYKQALAKFRKQYLATRSLEKNLGSNLTEQAAKKYYEAHKIQYSTDQAQVQHILLADEAAAKEILKKAKAADADFQVLAELYSRDPSAKNNRGDLGTITRDSPFIQEFKDAAFEGNEGEIIGPVKTAFGYHLIKVIKKKLGKPLEYSEVELRVKNDFKQSLITLFTGKLRQQAKIQVDDRALEKF